LIRKSAIFENTLEKKKKARGLWAKIENFETKFDLILFNVM